MAIQYDKMYNALVSSQIFDNVDSSDDEEIERDQRVAPVLLRGSAKTRFQSYYLPALVEMKRWISVIQHPDVTMLMSANMFKNIRAAPKLVGQSAEFEARLQPNQSSTPILKVVLLKSWMVGVKNLRSRNRMLASVY